MKANTYRIKNNASQRLHKYMSCLGTKLMMNLSENRLPLSSFSHENCHLEGIFRFSDTVFPCFPPLCPPLRFHTFAPPCRALCSRSADGVGIPWEVHLTVGIQGDLPELSEVRTAVLGVY